MNIFVTNIETVTATIDNVINVKRYNDVLKLFRVTAYVTRFFNNMRRDRNAASVKLMYVTSKEMVHSKELWIKSNQKYIEMDKDYKLLELQLNLKKDEFGIIRTLSRMKHACLPSKTKVPVFLNKEHRLSELIILYCHTKVYHRGVRQTLNEFRANYWITRGRSFVKKILRACIVCKKINARPLNYPAHSELPLIRFDERYPFAATGVDYLGPLYCLPVYGKKKTLCKAQIVLYTCISTRAVILDVVHSADGKSFVNSFRRFISRRGCPAIMVSDNGSAFIAEETQKFVSNRFIDWRFNIAFAPWQGGIWERLVSCVKRCIKNVVGVRRISYIELQTLVMEIEAILNNRPLCQDYDSEIEDVLTPNHLIYGRRLENINDSKTISIEIDGYNELDKKEKKLASSITYFWDIWRKEYLTSLREKQRLSRVRTESKLSVNDIVIVYDKHQPRHLWKLGRVVDLLKGNDKVIRGAKLKLGGSRAIITRPLNKLYLLEVRNYDKTIPSHKHLEINGEKLLKNIE